LAPEKGILSLLAAWKELDIPLKIRGTGQHEPETRALANANPRVELLPRLSFEERNDLLRGARFLVWPSLGEYETCGLVVSEAYACGVPVLASKTGVATERIVEGQTGIHFEPNDPIDLARKARWCWEHPQEMAAMGRNGRREYERALTPEDVLCRTLAIYQDLIEKKRAAFA
jgi:glycosyltransferase involved in cell wall biosynthesis